MTIMPKLKKRLKLPATIQEPCGPHGEDLDGKHRRFVKRQCSDANASTPLAKRVVGEGRPRTTASWRSNMLVGHIAILTHDEDMDGRPSGL